MARLRIFDLLKNDSFWVTTLTPFPSWGLNPLLGFSACSLPEITIASEDITDGTAQFTKKVTGKASVSNLTLSRGVRFYDSNFWDWIMDVIEGVNSPRRDMVLIHLARVKLLDIPVAFPGPVDLNFVPARMWKLEGCLPVRYKPGSDFDASQGEISVMELEVTIDGIEELTVKDLLKVF